MSILATAPPVPLCDLRAQLDPIRAEVRTAIDAVIDSQAFILGPQVAELEKRIAAYCQTSHAVGCTSGSDALILALMALDIKPGDEVITTPYTFFATVGAIVRLGAKPVFVDIDPATYNLRADQIAAVVTPRTRVIIPVHLFGQTADMGPILELARRHGLRVIEDAAQAIGASYHGRRAGSMGDIGCLSFFPSKNLGCMGDGGMCVTNDPALAEKMRVLRTHGAKKKYAHAVVGGNFRLDTLQAAVLLVKLRYLDRWNDARRANAERYVRLLQESGAAEAYTLPVVTPGCHHVFNQFIVRTPRRDHLLEVLQGRKIGCAVYYPSPMHLQECFRDLGCREGQFPESERACRETCALPMFPELTEEQQGRVVAALAAARQA